MDIFYEEKQGVGFIRRSLALILLLLGGGGAWLWLHWQMPEYASTMQILTTDNSSAAMTEQLLANCWRDENLLALAKELAHEIVTAENEKSVLLNTLAINLTVDETQWEQQFKSYFTVEWARERVLQVTLRYATFGTPRHHEVLQKIYQQIENEFKQTAENFTAQQLAKRDERVNQLNQQIAQLPDFAEHKKLAQATLTKLIEAVNKRTNPVSAWENTWRDFTEVTPYLDNIKRAWKAWQESCLQTAQLETQTQELSAWITLPQNQKITQNAKRIVYYEDTPELMRLKDKKAEIEATRMSLLQRATTLHPLAKKMSAEIDELNAQINALTRLPKTVDDFEERTNPQLMTWQRELNDLRSALGNKHLAEMEHKKQLLIAIENLRAADANALTTRWQQRKSQVTDELQLAKNVAIIAMPAAFTLYLSPTLPTISADHNYWRVYAIGIGLGLFCALLMMISRRKSTLNCTEPPAPLPEYSILGTVPDFNTKR